MKKILDACCGSRMFWFDKQNPDVLFADKRTESHVLCDGRYLEIKPDIEMDFTDMPIKDNTFALVVFDPPHLVHLGKSSWMAKKYGVLPDDWPRVIRDGFKECMRVLKPDGVLVFKWNETQVSVKEILSIIDKQPLFGHPTGRYNKTIWMAFMK
ncbi:class I SAM-dependent methyltransferase [Dysgonomonas sp. GY75]|uniref:class I SAM-dependent methyltransferase n=1 Tax=Dysgonomonas sp. GY75 TaxID=2780419 RepID=UPI001883A02A|nr:class I SAM-dependent methyltransferase [Dysgonomonas sp. GY75]